ncbi:TetR/AcrR family transcriptional regulator [Actinomadura parmotrematis]|uniref:TetR/AcrR family transcriptional regulator n=1 Tax=Actinomadura parmotrematis TaxID=2864039 RepID=A0ABS7FUX3_9ACTN|nr:TetR/AcrR family transcriptional regulator [Actinomadura parmotrematis]MBW8484214.1 TetR/AcrR family transcriptional regulator [Actinomadura parmotrematis]
MADTSPARRRLAPDERRAQILREARAAFSELPYAEVSTAAIAERVGVRRGLIHHYFGTKRELFLHVVRDLTATMAVSAPEPDASLPLERTVALCVDLYLDVAEKSGSTWFAAIDAEGFGQDPELLRIVNGMRDATVEHLLAVLCVPAPSDALRAVLRAYSGFVEAASRQWLQEGALDRAQAHTLLARTLLALVTDIAPVLERPS